MLKKFTFILVVLTVFTIQLTHAQQYIISPFAGNGTYAFSGDGGPATNAELNGPAGIVVDDTGNVFFCDESNNRIRKIDTKGIITTIAGNGKYSYYGDGGPGPSAALASPTGLAIDDSDNVFIADWGNHAIRKVSHKTGIITTVAGTGKLGFSGDGGPATAALLDYPYGVGVDSIGNIYIADAGNERVRKVDLGDTITTFAGNGVGFAYYGDGGPATDAAINWPTWVYPDNKGNVYIANAVLVRKVGPNDTITTVIGNSSGIPSGDGGLAINAGIGFMEGGGAFDDSGNFYFPEFYHEDVRKVYANDTIVHIGGIQDVQGFTVPQGLADNAEMSFPYTVAADKFGNIYLSDNGNQRIRKLSPCSAPVTTLPLNPHICRGVSIALTANGNNTYSWSPGSSLKDSLGYTVIATPSVTTTYTITGTTCKGSDTIVVTVDTVTVAPNLKITPYTTTLCAGQTVTLTAIGSPSTYTWSPIWSLNSSTGSSVVASPTTNTTYVVMEPTCSATDTAIVNVNPVPGIYVYPATSTQFCEGQTITLYEGGANDYIWTPMTGLDTTAFDSVNANPTVTTTYVVVGTSLGCSSIPHTIILTVDSIPTITINPPLPGFCTGASTTIIAGGAATYQWAPFTAISDTVGDTIVANPGVTTTYSITGTTKYGCVSATDTFTVAVDTMPVITVNPLSAGFCQGSSATLTAGGAPAYTWSPSTGLSDSTGSAVIASPTTSTTYIVTGVNIGCASIPDTVTISVGQAPNKPTITISATGDTLISSAATENQWYKNDTLIPGATGQYLVINGQFGSYTVSVTNPADGCSSVSLPLIATGINQLSVNNNQLSIYPNPATNQLTISNSQPIKNIEITNVLGQVVYKSLTENLNVTKQILNVSAFATGMYFIKVTTGDEIETQKIIIER